MVIEFTKSRKLPRHRSIFFLAAARARAVVEGQHQPGEGVAAAAAHQGESASVLRVARVRGPQTRESGIRPQNEDLFVKKWNEKKKAAQ